MNSITVITNYHEYYPKNPANPKRFNYSFQTDLLVKENSIPLVVIEVKYKRITTHNIITYSSKALMHKSIYPYLRYGLLIGEKKDVPTRFFTHNVGFDFAFAMRNFETIELLHLIIKEQIENAKELLKILKREKKVNYFNIVFNTN
ncbi:MAG TPA: hypothetical protein ENI29_08315 [bacterium]|nr:hypothetical protein [bacterium]